MVDSVCKVHFEVYIYTIERFSGRKKWTHSNIYVLYVVYVSYMNRYISDINISEYIRKKFSPELV